MFKLKPRNTGLQEYDEIVDLLSYSNFDCKVELFRLRRLGETDMYCKNFCNTDKFTLKKVPANYYAQAYRYVRKEELTDNDLLAYIDGRVFKMLTPLFKI